MSGYDMHRGDNPAYGLNEEYATDLFTEEAMKIIQRHEPPRPLYLQISHLAVHAPIESPDDYHNYDEKFKHIREGNRRKYASTYDRAYRESWMLLILLETIICPMLKIICTALNVMRLDHLCMLLRNQYISFIFDNQDFPPRQHKLSLEVLKMQVPESKS